MIMKASPSVGQNRICDADPLLGYPPVDKHGRTPKCQSASPVLRWFTGRFQCIYRSYSSWGIFRHATFDYARVTCDEPKLEVGAGDLRRLLRGAVWFSIFFGGRSTPWSAIYVYSTYLDVLAPWYSTSWRVTLVRTTSAASLEPLLHCGDPQKLGKSMSTV